MVSTSARLLELLSLLQSRSWWAGPDLAGRLDVAPRSVRRDIERLRVLPGPAQCALRGDRADELRIALRNKAADLMAAAKPAG